MKRLLWWLAGTFVLAVAILVFLPASLVTSTLPENSALQLADVRGSVWRGSAGRVQWNQQLLGALAWQVHPLSLLRGRIDAEVHLSGDIRADARVQRSWSSLHLQDLHSELPAAWLDPVLASPGLRPQGDLLLRIDNAELRDGELQALNGELQWNNASVSGAAVAALGDLRATFARADDGRVHGQVQDDDGPLDLRGNFVADHRSYQAELTLRARDARIAPAMRWLGQEQADGSRLLRLQGGLLPAPSQGTPP